MAAHSQSLHHVHISPQDSSAYKIEIDKLVEAEEIPEGSKTVKPSDKTTQEEEARTGRVKWSVYSTFVTYAYGGALVPVILLCHVLFQALEMASNYWMAWAADKEDIVSREHMIRIFALLSGGSSVFVLGRAVILSVITIRTSQRLFLRMTTSIFRAPITFFDSTPSSRILNRVSITTLLQVFILFL